MLSNLEVAYMMKLRHPRIVTFLGAGELVDTTKSGKRRGIFVVLEYVSGGDLAQRLKRCGGDTLLFRWDERLQCAMDIAEGMAYIHSQDLLHRDLKSLNVLYDKYGRCKIADLGLVKKQDAGGQVTEQLLDWGKEQGCGEQDGGDGGGNDPNLQLRFGTAWAGTSQWMAPEVTKVTALIDMRGYSTYGKPVDVFSFAVVMWELLTCRVPWRGTPYKHPRQILHAVHRGERPKFSREEHIQAPRGFVSLMRMCWDGKPEKRPTFDDVLKRLRSIASYKAKMELRSQQTLSTASGGVMRYRASSSAAMLASMTTLTGTSIADSGDVTGDEGKGEGEGESAAATQGTRTAMVMAAENGSATAHGDTSGVGVGSLTWATTTTLTSGDGGTGSMRHLRTVSAGSKQVARLVKRLRGLEEREMELVAKKDYRGAERAREEYVGIENLLVGAVELTCTGCGKSSGLSGGSKFCRLCGTPRGPLDIDALMLMGAHQTPSAAAHINTAADSRISPAAAPAVQSHSAVEPPKQKLKVVVMDGEGEDQKKEEEEEGDQVPLL